MNNVEDKKIFPVSKVIVDVTYDEKNEMVTLQAMEYIIKNEKVYNPLSLEEVTKYKKDLDLKAFKSDLPVINYNFKKIDDLYKLDSIDK